MPKEVIIWPEYISANLTRRQGRRVPSEMAVKGIDPESVKDACESIGIECHIEDGKKYSRVGVRAYGFRIIAKVSDGKSKQAIIKGLAAKLSEMKRQ